MNVSLGVAKWRMPNIKLLGCGTIAMKKTWRSRLCKWKQDFTSVGLTRKALTNCFERNRGLTTQCEQLHDPGDSFLLPLPPRFKLLTATFTTPPTHSAGIKVEWSSPMVELSPPTVELSPAMVELSPPVRGIGVIKACFNFGRWSWGAGTCRTKHGQQPWDKQPSHIISFFDQS